MTAPQGHRGTEPVEPALRKEFDDVADAIGTNPETAFEEFEAHRILTSWLADHGFVVAAVPELPTAFVARAGVGSPTIAILLEYDALPGIGHGCGHQLIASGGALAAILAARVAAGAGTILAVGCPAEESGAGKELLVQAGCFAEVDAALMFHPASRTVLARSSLAGTAVAVEFFGRAAHAAKTPDYGRNALSAMTLFLTAVDAFRSRLSTWGRINGIVTDGGKAANVIPDYTRAELMVREATRGGVLSVIDEIRAMAAGAAASTGTTSAVAADGPAYAERRNNRTLLRALAAHMESLGIAIDPPDVTETLGSSDIGNVSLTVPTIHPTIRITEQPIPSHTPDFAEAARQPFARDSTVAMACALARLAADIVTQPALLGAAREEFERGGFDAPGTDFRGVWSPESG